MASNLTHVVKIGSLLPFCDPGVNSPQKDLRMAHGTKSASLAGEKIAVENYNLALEIR